MSYYTALVQGLLNDGFKPIQNLYDSEAITQDSKYIGVLKREGACIYSVVAFNTDNEPYYKKIYEQVTRFLHQQFSVSQNTKLIVTGIFVSENPDEELKKFCTVEVDDFDGIFMDFRWIADISKGRREILGYQPKAVLNVGNIADKAFNEETSSAMLGDMYTKAVKSEFDRIKSKSNVFTIALLVINIIVFTAMELAGGSKNTNVLLDFGALENSLVMQGEWFRLFTCMFLHIGALHLISNGLSLYILGSRIERYYGKIWFLIIYILSGLGASIVSLMFSDAVSAGASGAIFGLVGAMLVYTFVVGKSMDGFDLWFSVFYAVIALGSGKLIPNVNNYAHLGGFVTGMVVSVVQALAIKRHLQSKEG
jgi:membrane associated rhomboid family serine protease